MNTDIPKHIAEAIERAWPGGILEVTDCCGAPLGEADARVRASLSSIPRTALLYERHAPAGPQLDQYSDEPRSYHVFFLAPTSKSFRFEADTLEPDECGADRRLDGAGTVGCMVAVSLVAPFALVSLNEFAEFENGRPWAPDVDPHVFDLAMKKLDLEEHYGEMLGKRCLATLTKLRARLVEILEGHGFTVIPEADLDRPVPWLRAGEGVREMPHGETMDVRRAFFFHGV